MEDIQANVTIGFPVYNVEKYIYRSLESALNQDFDNYEIIVVDDCGSDKSMEIVDKLAKSHPKGEIIRIIRHQQNKGLAEARNTAIKNAKGKYIFFLDSDDHIPTNALSTLFNAAEKYQTDVTYGSSYKEKEGEIFEDSDNKLSFTLFINPGEYTTFLYSNIQDIIPEVVWNILFSMDFLRKNDLLFPDIRRQEDLAFDEVFQPCVKKAVILPDKTYYYVVREDSLMNRKVRDKINISEVERAIRLCNIMKKSCYKYRNEVFYAGKCAKVMKRCFFQAAGILKHRHQFTENITDKEIRDIMKHPDSFLKILTFKQLKSYNLLYFFIGILPPKLSIKLIKYICHKKNYF